MADRERQTKLVFKNFFEGNKNKLEQFAGRKGEKYIRESWMLKANPAAELTLEILVEEDQANH